MRELGHHEIRLPKQDANYWPPTHPVHALFHPAFTNQQCHVSRPGLAGVFPKGTVDQWFRIQEIGADSDHLKSSFELCPWTGDSPHRSDPWGVSKSKARGF
jgi:hypothetical protein